MTETVPADIAAAIEEFRSAAYLHGLATGDGTGTEDDDRRIADYARARLDRIILAHLRNADEMKAALERIEQGV